MCHSEFEAYPFPFGMVISLGTCVSVDPGKLARRPDLVDNDPERGLRHRLIPLRIPSPPSP